MQSSYKLTRKRMNILRREQLTSMLVTVLNIVPIKIIFLTNSQVVMKVMKKRVSLFK